MNTKIRSMVIVFSLALMSGCVAYAPYPGYSGSYYGGYGYAAPVVPVPVPMFQGGWGHRGHHGHHRHH